MKFLVNDLSMNGQFHDLASFRASVARIMAIRQLIRQNGYDLFCHRGLSGAQVTPDAVMQQAVGSMCETARRAWMQWVTRQGPHWEDQRLHDGGDYLEVNGDIVTDSAVGEAAVCVSRGLPRELVSFDPSSWMHDPVVVRWTRDDDSSGDIAVPNHWTLGSVEQALADHPQPIASWADVATRSAERCSRLTFSESAFDSLRGHPFSAGAAERVGVLLNTLDQMKGCFVDGGWNAEGLRLYQDHFTGRKAWFSDSSDTEKRDFKEQLSFRHPDDADKTLCCTWHGKVKTPQLRVHFSWPITEEAPLYVVYVGPKITTR